MDGDTQAHTRGEGWRRPQRRDAGGGGAVPPMPPACAKGRARRVGRACPSRVPLFCSTKGGCAHPPDCACPPSFAAPPPLLRAVARQREGCEHDPGSVRMQDPCSPHLSCATCARHPAYGTTHAWHTKGGACRGLACRTTWGRAHTQRGWGTASLQRPGSHVTLGSCAASLYAHGSRAKG